MANPLDRLNSPEIAAAIASRTGRRWYIPGSNETDVIRLMPGDPRLDAGNVHSGPYIYFTQTAMRHPLKGNAAPWPPPAATKEQFLDDLMLDTIDDIIGLWDIAAIAAATFPERSKKETLRLAKETVFRVFERGWIGIGEKTPDPANPGHWLQPSLVPGERAKAALSDDASWDRKRVAKSSIQYMIHSTDLGEREIYADLSRRGLFADTQHFSNN